MIVSKGNKDFICDICEKHIQHGEMLISGEIVIYKVDKKLLQTIEKVLDDYMHICSVNCFDKWLTLRVRDRYLELIKYE